MARAPAHSEFGSIKGLRRGWKFHRAAKIQRAVTAGPDLCFCPNPALSSTWYGLHSRARPPFCPQENGLYTACPA